MEFGFPARRVGFYVGVFIGAKLQGASHDDLGRIGEAIIVTCVQQWKYQAKQKIAPAKADSAKTLDGLERELGKTIKGMAPQQKREYARSSKG